MTTYGEQVLAQAQRRIHSRKARRRVLTLFIPGTVTAVWAVNDLLGQRVERLQADGAGIFSAVGGVLLPAVWTICFVIIPLFAAVKAEPLPSGAVLAFAAGPILTPMLFGAGGWHPWQIAIMLAVCGAVIGGMIERSRDRRAA